MTPFMERVAPVVDATIATLAKTSFIEDPVAGGKILAIDGQFMLIHLGRSKIGAPREQAATHSLITGV